MNVNGNSYQEGRATARPQYFAPEGQTGIRTKITFDPPRVPVILRPANVPGHPVEGKNGPQYRWEFEGNQVAWFDPPVHREIVACLEVTGCNEIAITKVVTRGQPPRFTVQGVDDQTGQAIATGREPARQAGIRELEKRSNQPSGFDPAPPRKATRAPRYIPEERIEAETAPPCNAMSEALMEATLAVHEVSAITGAHGMAVSWRAEDIRALAITIYIAKNGGKR